MNLFDYKINIEPSLIPKERRKHLETMATYITDVKNSTWYLSRIDENDKDKFEVKKKKLKAKKKLDDNNDDDNDDDDDDDDDKYIDPINK